MKSFIFFVVMVILLLYLQMFWQNRNEKVNLKTFGQKTEMNIGWLAFGLFIDGTIFATVLIWLLK